MIRRRERATGGGDSSRPVEKVECPGCAGLGAVGLAGSDCPDCQGRGSREASVPAPALAPGLTRADRAALVEALRAHDRGERVLVAATYGRRTRSGPRLPDEDFIALPGASVDLHVGELVGASRDAVLLRDLARADGVEVGMTTLRFDGLTRFRLLAAGGVSARPRPAPSTSSTEGRHARGG